MNEMIYTHRRITNGEILDAGVYEGYEYAIISHGTHPCAYVRIPENHPYFQIFYDDIPIDCHGGLTYSEKPCLHLAEKKNGG